MHHRTTAELVDGLDEVRASPPDSGVLELIVRRPSPGERESIDAGELSNEDGLVGDGWRERGSRHTPDGSAELPRQLTLMNCRAAMLVAGDRSRWGLAGDQLYVDLDISEDNLPPGTRLRIGNAVVEISPEPHTGCQKFTERFGLDAVRFVNTEEGSRLRLRGVNARVVEAGSVRVRDAIVKMPARSLSH